MMLQENKSLLLLTLTIVINCNICYTKFQQKILSKKIHSRQQVKTKVNWKYQNPEYWNWYAPLPWNCLIRNPRVAHGECLPPGKIGESNKTQMILLTDFILRVKNFHRAKSVMLSKRPPAEIDAGLYVLMETLQGNLNHENVQSIYVFVDSLAAADYLSSFNLINSENLVIQHLPKQHTIKTYVEFAAGRFIDRIMMIG